MVYVYKITYNIVQQRIKSYNINIKVYVTDHR